MADAVVLIDLFGGSKGWLVIVIFWMNVDVGRLVWALVARTRVSSAEGGMNEGVNALTAEMPVGSSSKRVMMGALVARGPVAGELLLMSLKMENVKCWLWRGVSEEHTQRGCRVNLASGQKL